MAVAVKLSPIRWPAMVTGSTWSNVLESIWEVPLKARGKYTVPYPGPDGTLTDTVAPRLTNGDVVRLVMGYLAAVAGRRESFPLWAQLAAVAYAWDPDRKDSPRKITDPLIRKRKGMFDTSKVRRDEAYPAPMLVELWLALMACSRELDFDRVPNPRVDLDGDFGDVVFQGEVAAALKEDGAASTAGFKMPMGCKSKDGKRDTITPKCTERMKEWPYLCTKWECDVRTIEIDPTKAAKKQVEHAFKLLLLIVGAWLLFDNQPRPNGARRGR